MVIEGALGIGIIALMLIPFGVTFILGILSAAFPKLRKYAGYMFGVTFIIWIGAFVFGFNGGIESFGNNSKFDHYKTDVTINVDTTGKIMQTETYYFKWNNQESSEMYISMPDDKSSKLDKDSIVVKIDDVVATKALTYGSGRADAASGGEKFAKYFYRNYDGAFEINAFYKQAHSGQHKVEFSYEVSDVVSKYNDCIDMYYKVFTNFTENLKDLTVNVNMPAGMLKENTKIFGHGDPNGYASFVDESGNVKFTSTNLRAHTMFEIRVVNKQVDLFPSLVTKTTKSYSSILAEEQKFYDDTQRAVLLGKIQIGVLITMVVIAAVFVLFRKKLIKRNKPNFNQDYVRDVPNLKPNVVSTLGSYDKFIKGSIGEKITATILNLALEKVIAIEEGEKKDMVFVALDRNKKLTSFEQDVFNMLFENTKYIGSDKDKVSLKQVKKSLSSYSVSNQTLSRKLVEDDKIEFESLKYDDKSLQKRNNTNKRIPFFVTIALAIISIILLVVIGDFTKIGITAFVTAVTLIGLTLFIGKIPNALTIEGEDEFAKTKALKKFYTDMTLLKERQTMELPLWEQHLVYATALGVADKVIKELDVRLQTMSTSDPYYHSFIYFHTFTHIGGISGMSTSLSSIRSVSLSSFNIPSSGSGGFGGGGGFSGGGGGGFGGGGGGHR